MSVLYLCYQSLLEPLTQTQVVAYLEGLAQADYRIVLLTFEPRRLTADETRQWRERMAAKGIVWHWRRYHKRPTVPATGWDVFRGVVAGRRLIRRYGVQMVHARAHVPGVMGLMLKRMCGVKLLFDVRGLMAEEYADAGVWPAGGRLFRIVKRIERRLVAAADGVIVLTRAAKSLLEEWYPQELAGKPVEVIPCCVDRRAFGEGPDDRHVERNGIQRTRIQNESRCGSLTRPTLIYVGKLGGWYPIREMAAFFAAAGRVLPGLQVRVLTQSDPEELRNVLAEQGTHHQVTIGRVPPTELPDELAQAQIGLSLIKPCFSKIASSPTKLAEYLAAGLPVVSTSGIGDTDEILTGNGLKPVGVLIRELTEDQYRRAVENLSELLKDTETPARCREAARREFDLDLVGWTRYRRMYDSLLRLREDPQYGSRGDSWETKDQASTMQALSRGPSGPE